MSMMLREIREQPQVIEKTLKAERKGFERLRRRFDKDRPRLVVLAARGTSDNAAQFGKYLIEITTGIPVSLAAPSVATLYHAKLKLDGALVAAVSHTAYLEKSFGELTARLKKGGVFTDVKSAYDPAAVQAAGYQLWRL